jgi:hypothetical protein
VAAVNELDDPVDWVRAHGPAPLLLDGWDDASTWGWDDTTGSLYANLWRNTDDPATTPTIAVRPGDLTPPITVAVTLAQHIAMCTDSSPWAVDTAMDEAIRKSDDSPQPEGTALGREADTEVTVTDGHEIWWPQSLGSRWKRPA